MPNRMAPVHLGEIRKQERDELDMSANAFAKALAVPTDRITAILRTTRGVTAATARRLARLFGIAPRLWLNLQQSFDLQVAKRQAGKKIAASATPRAA